jgi:hypothetical protein
MKKLLLAQRRLMFHDLEEMNDSHEDDDDDKNDNHDSNVNLIENKSLQPWDTILSQSYDQHKQVWKTVLNQRHHDLQLHSGITAKTRFQLLDSDFWTQVEASSKVHLNQSLQLSSSKSWNLLEFDDSKLYQYMLHDFLCKKRPCDHPQQDTTKNTSHRWNHGISSKVDRRASKGRKLRYTVHPKLVHFTFPQNRVVSSSFTVMEENEWFASLLGGAVAATVASDGHFQQPRPRRRS